jgi:hypothetical protein
LVSEIFDNTKPITKDQIQQVLDENGINFSVNFLSRMGYEKCRFFTTKSKRFNDDQKAIIAKCKRQCEFFEEVKISGPQTIYN